MTVAWVVIAVMIAAQLAAVAVADALYAGDRDQAAGPLDEPGRDVPRSHSGPAGGSSGSSGDWLPFTPRPDDPLVTLSAPRICGGRLARVV